MPNRHVEGAYRYAFQGQEKDAETGMEAFELRLWDARIGRWLTTDPYGQYNSPYLGMGNNPINGVDSNGGFWEELKNFFRGKGWISNAGLEYLQNNNITDYESHFSKDVLDYKGYHTVGYDDPETGELVFHRFKNVDDLRIENAVGFRVTSGIQGGLDLSNIFRLEGAIFSVTLLEYDIFNGWYNTFDENEREFRMDFLSFGGAYAGGSFEFGGSLTKTKHTGLASADISGHVQGGFTSLFQLGLDFGNDDPRANGFYHQHGASLGGQAIIGVEIFVHAKVHHGAVPTNE